MTPKVSVGAVTALIGAVLIFFGLFGFFGRCAVPGVRCPSPSVNEVLAYTGLLILVLGVTILLWSGWRGSVTGWVLAAAATVPAVWFVYELARQSLCPLLSDPAASRACLAAYGEMTAPVLSAGVALATLGIGWLRLRRVRSPHDLASR